MTFTSLVYYRMADCRGRSGDVLDDIRLHGARLVHMRTLYALAPKEDLLLPLSWRNSSSML